MAEFSIACRPCTEGNGGVPVMALETARNLVDENTPGVTNFPPEARGRGKILLVRLMCPRCSRQSLMFPTRVAYDCRNCGHHEEDYIRGGATEPTKNAGIGISYKESFTSKAESADLLRQLRQGSIGGFGTT